MKRHDRHRLFFQLMAAALFNGYIRGFKGGKIFTGKTKSICVPVLNCYSCPGALGACPIGSLQAVTGGIRHNFPFYVLGTLMLFGTVLGRLVCGFLCPFGLFQDLLYKIPTKKVTVPGKADRILRFLKYAVLVIFVILLPVLLVNKAGVSAPYFCKLICPAGTLEGGIPHMIANKELRKLAGILFDWKMLVLIAVIIGSMHISRFFCRYICPLGAFYSLFNRFSMYRMSLAPKTCIGCRKCEHVCPMQVEVLKNINSPECIRCGRCMAACPSGAIRTEFLNHEIKRRRQGVNTGNSSPS